MVGNIKSALIAGVVAFVIYTVVALLTGATFGSAVGVGLIFMVGTVAVTFHHHPRCPVHQKRQPAA